MRTRHYTNLILERIEDGSLSREAVVENILQWLSEKEVEDFYLDCLSDDEFEDEDDEHDGQPDEMQEWHDFDPDC